MAPLTCTRPGVTLMACFLACAGCAELTKATPKRGRVVSFADTPESEPAEPLAQDSVTPDLAATDAAQRVLELVASIQTNMRETRYQGRTEVWFDDGYFAWDCSGMAGWILRRAAPAAFRTLRSRRPLARDFFGAIDRAPATRPRRGWQRVDDVEDLRPGDLFAFLRSPLSETAETGHVGFVVGVPEREGTLPNAYSVRVADATAIPHQDDTRGDEGGFGFGTIVFMMDETGESIGYRWAGPDGPELSPTRVVFGRVHR